MFAVTVTLQIDPAQWDAFLPLMLENAARSRADEPGCLRFDVCRDDSAPHIVFLYEIYQNAAAFETHKQTPHFKAFDAAAGPMITARSLSTWAMVSA